MIMVVEGDITMIPADAIVNAANTSLLGGGGVDGAIHRVGGKEILEGCMKIRAKQSGCKVGEAVITVAGKLPAKYVIHTVGPVWNGGMNGEEKLLANAYRNSLLLAVEYEIQTINFPSISTGIYRFPKDKAAKIAIATVRQFLKLHPVFKEIRFVCFDERNAILYRELLQSQNF